MLRSRQFRGFSLTLVIGAAMSMTAASQTRPAGALPPTAPTSVPSAQTTLVKAPPVQPDTAARAQRADVEYASGLLSVTANNSSLNQILREISRQTGMKITGGVRDERIFGHYGPAAPELILTTLIDHNTTNMELRESANAPTELILTPRGGGPSPPNPAASGFDDNDQDRDNDNNSRAPLRHGPRQGPQPFGRPNQVVQPPLTSNPGSVPPSIPQPANNVNGSPQNTSPTVSTMPVTNSVPTDSIPTPSITPPTNGIVDAPNPPDPGTVNPVTTNPPVDSNPPATDSTTTPPDPNAPAKTPEQIYQQLQQLQQQRQQQQRPGATVTPQ